ncbi:muscarinic acetylcholine receptor M2-like [Dreissena polymorpha]|uniref:G-protein coupled receptors family 1 profile domain-containing protein n=1 Tax=Dreissena polymorpha TaxID=45954 RepID=A0A9D4DIV1_DREPO|nr:muscarinic acetylcholine receptor M2-like [Dreissena polymorpha]KAH3748384.1 hypothetical protein DPMN_182829 [Dreissena polymorpha]
MGSSSNETLPPMTSADRFEDIKSSEQQRLLPTVIFLSLIIGIGLVGNILVLYVFGTKIKRSNSQIFIFVVAAVDLFSCCIAIPYEITLLMQQFMIQNLWMCKGSRFINALGTCTTSLILVFIAVDRFRKVCRPFQNQITYRMAKVFCTLSVVFGILVALPALFLYGNTTYEIKQQNLEDAVLQSECLIADKMDTSLLKVYNTAMLSGLFLIGIVTMSVLYCLIGFKIRKQSKLVGLMSASGMSNHIMPATGVKNSASIHEQTSHVDVVVRKSNDILMEDSICRPRAENCADFSLVSNGEFSYASYKNEYPIDKYVSYKNTSDKLSVVRESGDDTQVNKISNEIIYIKAEFKPDNTIGTSQKRVSSIDSHNKMASCGLLIDLTDVPQTVQCRKDARARKTTVILFIISFTFILNYLPRVILMATRAMKGEFVEGLSDEGRAVYIFFSRFYFMNCAINPAIYGLCDTRFRKSCADLFSRCCSRKNTFSQ